MIIEITGPGGYVESDVIPSGTGATPRRNMSAGASSSPERTPQGLAPRQLKRGTFATTSLPGIGLRISKFLKFRIKMSRVQNLQNVVFCRT
jgi:hypothetical protein